MGTEHLMKVHVSPVIIENSGWGMLVWWQLLCKMNLNLKCYSYQFFCVICLLLFFNFYNLQQKKQSNKRTSQAVFFFFSFRDYSAVLHLCFFMLLVLIFVKVSIWSSVLWLMESRNTAIFPRQIFCLGKMKYCKYQGFLLGKFDCSHITPFLNSLLFPPFMDRATRGLTPAWADLFVP